MAKYLLIWAIARWDGKSEEKLKPKVLKQVINTKNKNKRFEVKQKISIQQI